MDLRPCSSCLSSSDLVWCSLSESHRFVFVVFRLLVRNELCPGHTFLLFVVLLPPHTFTSLFLPIYPVHGKLSLRLCVCVWCVRSSACRLFLILCVCLFASGFVYLQCHIRWLPLLPSSLFLSCFFHFIPEAHAKGGGARRYENVPVFFLVFLLLLVPLPLFPSLCPCRVYTVAVGFRKRTRSGEP